jgi:hypothetical protein
MLACWKNQQAIDFEISSRKERGRDYKVLIFSSAPYPLILNPLLPFPSAFSSPTLFTPTD